MRFTAILAGAALAGCNMLPQSQSAPQVSQERVDAFIVAVEQSDCRLDPVDHEPIHTAGFTDAELSAIGDQLVTEGRARLLDNGDLMLLTENCL